ncbi:MAG: hypothetical protein WAL56_03205 [Candidatus Sulfotelmatobacter sp.]
MTTTSSSSQQPESPAPDYGALWSSARQLHPIYAELAREFVIDAPAFAALDEPVDSPDRETVEHAQKWFHDMDERIQVHQLRQFLQTSSLVDNGGLVAMLQHFLGKAARTDASRDKIDFLLVQYFSQIAPTELEDDGADLAYVARALDPVLGSVELKAPVWLNALDRVLESARRCRSLDELLHGGVLEQGRKAKVQAGDLFYLPVALVAFTRFGYLMRRAFFRLMLTDLNKILDGLTELEEQGVETIDCRRAQFSAQEPIVRLRMICQSWKVMFQAEYSSGQPLRMLVDLLASVDAALGRGAEAEGGEKAAEATAAAKAAPAKGPSAKNAPIKPAPVKAATVKTAVRAATAGAESGGALSSKTAQSQAPLAKTPPEAAAKTKSKFAVTADDAEEFQVSAAPDWNPDEDSQPGQKK